MSGSNNRNHTQQFQEKQASQQRLLSPLSSPSVSPGPGTAFNRSASGVARGEVGTEYGPYSVRPSYACYLDISRLLTYVSVIKV